MKHGVFLALERIVWFAFRVYRRSGSMCGRVAFFSRLFLFCRYFVCQWWGGVGCDGGFYFSGGDDVRGFDGGKRDGDAVSRAEGEEGQHRRRLVARESPSACCALPCSGPPFGTSSYESRTVVMEQCGLTVVRLIFHRAALRTVVLYCTMWYLSLCTQRDWLCIRFARPFFGHTSACHACCRVWTGNTRCRHEV